jgi:hypothetical protein
MCEENKNESLSVSSVHESESRTQTILSDSSTGVVVCAAAAHELVALSSEQALPIAVVWLRR